MSGEIVAAVVGVAGGVATALLTVLYGPAWKARLDRRREQAARSTYLLGRYSEPLARAAYDLQSRLYNIDRGFLDTYYGRGIYAEASTLWMLGQYLAWVEVLRREVQLLDLGDLHRTAELQRELLEVSGMLASDKIPDPLFMVFRANQRAIGELMVIERNIEQQTRSDCLGYAEFVKQLDDKGFAIWFADLKDNIAELAREKRPSLRLIYLQRALIDLVDFLDPDRVRFPNPNLRGKIPLPADAARIRRGGQPTGQVAGFVFEAGAPWPIFDAWRHQYGLTALGEHTHRRVPLPRRWWHRSRWTLVVAWDGSWLEMTLARTGPRFPRTPSPPRHSRRLTDDLLVRFDRPVLDRGWTLPTLHP